MIRESSVGDRRFDIVGFGDFESMLLGPTDAQFRSLDRIANLFDHVEVDVVNPFDARPATLKKIYLATAELVTSIAGVASGAALIDQSTLKAAYAVVQQGKHEQK
jgi:hypothetical protein